MLGKICGSITQHTNTCWALRWYLKLLQCINNTVLEQRLAEGQLKAKVPNLKCPTPLLGRTHLQGILTPLRSHWCCRVQQTKLPSDKKDTKVNLLLLSVK